MRLRSHAAQEIEGLRRSVRTRVPAQAAEYADAVSHLTEHHEIWNY